MTDTSMKFNKVEAGHYATEDGRYAVMVDGYEPGKHVGAEGDWKHGSGYEGFVGGEWAAVYYKNGDGPDGHDENLDWFPTMREAKAYAESHAEMMRRAAPGTRPDRTGPAVS